MDTAIDWSSKPYPWNELGPAFREEVKAIMAEPVEVCRRRAAEDKHKVMVMHHIRRSLANV